MLAARELCNSTAQEFLSAQEPNEARFQTTLLAANFLLFHSWRRWHALQWRIGRRIYS